MDEIKRIGPPTPINVRGSEYDLSVPLNATPSRAWRQTFQDPDEWKEPFHPSRITVKHRALIFTSDDYRAPLWMALIDRWIAAANQRHANALSSTAGPQAAEDKNVDEGWRGLQEASQHP